MKSIGYQNLIERFGLNVCELLRKSFLGQESQNKVVEKDDGEDRYFAARRITIDESWQSNLLFAIKYEGVNFEVLKAFFNVCDCNELANFVRSVSTGAYHRRIWFLYEFLTGRDLPIEDLKMGNYVAAIDEDVQLALPSESAPKLRRYRIANNVLGNAEFCPYVMHTDAIKEMPAVKLKQRSNELLGKYPTELLYRAIQYLYVKETKSSFAIERETPTQKRMEGFIAVLKDVSSGTLDKAALCEIQNRIVDERYQQHDWRTTQVYVGETINPTHERVHFVAVKPQDVAAFMDGFVAILDKVMATGSLDAVILAAVMSFAFVFIHPFDDGNGRIHRYLMHYILARFGFTPEKMIFPVSAVLIKRQKEYDRMLETFSRRLMECIQYDMDEAGEVTVRGETADYYRFIDYTPIVSGFQRIIAETIETEWKYELDYLVSYDRMREGMREVVDMPDKKANQFILFANQNGGKLSQSKRKLFLELTDEEIWRMEQIVQRETKTLV